MRKGFEGLYGLVRDELGADPLSGHLFLFSNRTRTRLKALVWDGSGLWVCSTPGEGTLPLAGSETATAYGHDAQRGTGDAGERSGSEASPAAQLVSPQRVKKNTHKNLSHIVGTS